MYLSIFFIFQFVTCTLISFKFTHALITEISSRIFQVLEKNETLELKTTHVSFKIPRLTPLEHEKAMGMLQANVTSSVIA